MIRSDPVTRLITADDTYATTIFVWFLDTIAAENPNIVNEVLTEWYPSTLRDAIERRIGKELPEKNFDRFMAAKTIVTTNLFRGNVYRFVPLVMTLCGNSFNAGEIVEIPEVEELAWGVCEGMLLDPSSNDDDGLGFSKEIRVFIGYILAAEGYAKLPDIFRMALGFRPMETDMLKKDEKLRTAAEQKNLELENFLRGHLHKLLAQIQMLPLKTGTTKIIAAKAEKLLPAVDAVV